MNRLTLSHAASQIAQGKLSPLEILEGCLERIARLESDLRAWVGVDADAARAQAEYWEARQQAGETLPPLAGLPLGIKDIIDVQYWPTRAGAAWRSDLPAVSDAPVVARLRAAGAILLGKTVTTELACFDPPPTRNPWNLERTPGGSSSGSAVAVASGMCLAALGSQTGGSITRPASFCGIAGLKPTHAALPLDQVVPVSQHLDHVGPMARSVEDLGLLWHVLSGEPQPPAESPTRFALLDQGFFSDRCSTDVWQQTEQAVQKLREAGAEVQSLGLPGQFDRVHVMHRRIMAADAARNHGEHTGEPMGAAVRELIEEGRRVSESDYAEALAFQDQFRRDVLRWLEPAQIVVTPATVTVAPSPETTGDPAFNSPWSLAGVPTCNLPIGLVDGLPVGLQLIGSREAHVLSAGAWCEQQIPAPDGPPL